MNKQKISGPALFMYAVIFVTVITAAVCFGLYYGNKTDGKVVLWTGIVAFMIVYHFWGRIIMGNVSKLFQLNHNHWWFQEKPFEKGLYKLLLVKKWKGKALTYNPEAFSLKTHSLDEVVAVMTKSEVDHWINEVISLCSILFSLLWGELWIFVITAVFAMIFDAQFIVIQRFNRPRLLNILEKQRLQSKAKGLHNMKLHSSPFEKIKSGEKTIELRLYDEKRQQIKAGDQIVFTNNITGETLHTTVMKLHRFDSFEELYERLPLLRCGYTTEDIDKAHPSDMEQYYSVEEQKKYGVVGIELCRAKDITEKRAVQLSGQDGVR